MKLKKLLATLILSAAALGALACQYEPPTPTPQPTWRGYQRCFYLSGVNAPDNHIAGFAYNGGILSYTAVNHQTVHLPLTVYVGAADLAGSYYAPTTGNLAGVGAELSGITMTLQYRVLPDTTWHTAATKKFSAGDLAIMTKKKLFGSAQIDCEASPGDVILIRLYLTVETYTQISSEGQTLSTSSNLENADPTSEVVSASSDIAASETIQFYVSGKYLAPGLNLSSTNTIHNNTYVNYQDGWTPQFVMAVRIANKRRPGK